MHGPRVARRAVAIASHALRICLVLVLSGALSAATALAAEVVAVEVELVAGTENGKIVARQGEWTSFEIRVSATENMNPLTTASDPAQAMVANLFKLMPAPPGVSWVNAIGNSAPLPFWADPSSPGGNKVTWTGASSPYTVSAQVFVPPDTPAGDYLGAIRIIIADPGNGGSPGLLLRNVTADPLTIQVIAGGDTTPPTTSASLSGTAGSNGWFLGDTTVSFTVADNPGGMGVDHTEYSLDHVTWIAGDSVVVSGEGVHTVYYRSVDGANNVEAEKSIGVRIDANDPTVSVTGVSEGDCVQSATIAFDADDTAAGSGIAGKSAVLDGVPFASGSTVATEGHHTLVVTATDDSGRGSSAIVNFTIDRSAPVIHITSPTDGAAYKDPVAFHFTVTDPEGLASVTPSHLDGTSFADEGEYTVSVDAVDRAGNGASASVTFIVDTTAPQTTANLAGTPGDNDWFRSQVDVTLNPVDPVSGDTFSGVTGTEYAVDDGPLGTYAGTFTISDEGSHAVAFRSTDRAGNVEALQGATVRADWSSPTVDIALDGTAGTPGSGWWTSKVAATITGDDDVSGVARLEYDLDGAGWAPVTGDVTIGEGDHLLRARAFDVAGNVSEVAEDELYIDLTPPETTCTLSGLVGDNGWFLGDVTVELQADDSGSGVAGTECSTDGGSTWQPYSAPFVVSGAGVTALQFRSTDRAGNGEVAKSEAIHIDRDDPTVTVGGVAAGDWLYEAMLTFSADDQMPGSGIAWVTGELDGVEIPSGTLVTSEGPHTLEVTTRDNAGRMASKSVTFTIDRTAPEILVENPADGGAYNLPQELRFAVTDADPLAVWTSDYPYGHIFSAEGGYTVNISADDRAGNHADRSLGFMIDLTPPTTECEPVGSAGLNGWWISQVTAHLNATDPESNGVASGVVATYWRVNGGDWTEGIVAPITSEGANLLEYYSKDRAGNAGAIQQVEFKVDLTDPVITITSPTAGTYLYGQTIRVGCGASDAVSGLDWSAATLNGVPTSDGASCSLTKPGVNAFVMTACDLAGRTAAVTVPFTVAFQAGTILPPSSLGHVWNAGRMMPVKFTVLDHAGRPTGDAVAMLEARLNGVLIASGQAYVQWENGTPFYQYNVKTLKGQAGTLKVRITLNDGVTVMTKDILLR